MKSKLGLMLILSALVVTGCGPITAQPTAVLPPVVTKRPIAVPLTSPPAVTPTVAVEASDVQAARDATLTYISEHYEQTPALGLTWTEEFTPERPFHLANYRYTAHTEHGAEDWVVQVYYPMMPPETVVYLVTVANRATGFRWEGQVDAAGGMTELLDDVLAARDAALAYASEHYGEQAPAPGLTWTEDFIGVLISELGCGGDETFQWAYAAEHWAVVISYRFLAPKPVVYGVSVQDLAAHFYWEGEVDAAGQVTQQSPPQ